MERLLPVHALVATVEDIGSLELQQIGILRDLLVEVRLKHIGQWQPVSNDPVEAVQRVLVSSQAF
jgi:hypothetical protein